MNISGQILLKNCISGAIAGPTLYALASSLNVKPIGSGVAHSLVLGACFGLIKGVFQVLFNELAPNKTFYKKLSSYAAILSIPSLNELCQKGSWFKSSSIETKTALLFVMIVESIYYFFLTARKQ
jgi:hypothetical protein